MQFGLSINSINGGLNSAIDLNDKIRRFYYLEFKEWHWEITRKCNLNCQHCITDCGLSQKDELTTDEALQAVEVMANLGCKSLMITGGEPLVHTNLISILEKCQKLDIDVQFLTNGIVLNQNLVKQLVGIVEAVSVSLDGSRSEINDLVRGSGSFQKATSAIQLLTEYMPVYVYSTVSKANIGDIENIIEYSQSLGAVGVHFSEIKLAGRAAANFKMFGLSKEQKRSLRLFVKKITRDSENISEDCDADFSALYMASNGMVYRCTEIALNHQKFALGNIRNYDLYKRIIKIRENLANKPNPKCCYGIYKGDNIVFCLNNENDCSVKI